MRLRFIGILAVLAMIMAFTASAVSAVTYATVTGYAEGTAANNQEETWEALTGGDCTKINPGGDTYELPALEAGLAYDLVIVKAGSDQSTEEGANTLFDNPTAGQTVFADADGDGAFSDGDKTISHIIICTRAVSPTLSLEKVVTGPGASATQAFSFGVTTGGTAVTGSPFSIAAADAPQLVASASGEYVITEAALENWSLTGVDCGKTASVDLAARTVTVTVGTDEDVTCTFTNNFVQVTAPSPSLTLDKNVTAGDAALAFGFSLNGTAIAGLSANDAPRVISTTAGAHTIVEAAQSGWTLASVVCRDNATSATLTTTAVASGVTVTVGADQDVTCVFTNTPQGGAVLPGNPATPASPSSPPVRQGTLGSSVPNTAMEASAAVLPLELIGTLGGLLLIASGIGLSLSRRRTY